MHKSILLFLLTIFAVNISISQSIEVEGKIVDQFLNPIPNANVVFKSLVDESIIKYETTNDKGFFNSKFVTKDDRIQIKISQISYKNFTDTLSLKNRKIVYYKTLENNSINLNEVVIVQKKIKDTMKINTKRLNLTEKSTLRDILNKTEGFNVSNEGGITFRGKAINKILINQKEVFVNQNKIALDNLDYGIMDDLELINNYKDKFDLNFDSNTSSVLNVNTKKEFKGILKTYGDFGYGYKDKFLIKLRGFFFSDELNAFLTTNNNRIGKKEFSFKDVSNAFKTQSSSFFKENFTSFFVEDDLLKDSFDSSTSLTLRKETKKNRLGFVLYYNNVDFSKTSYNATEKENNVVVKKEELNYNNKGNSFLSNLVFTNIINKKTLLFFKSNIAYSSNTMLSSNNIQNSIPIINNIIENNIQNPNSFLIANELSLKKSVNKKGIILLGYQNNFEKSNHDFKSEFIINTVNNIAQSYGFTNNYSKFYLDFDRKMGAYTWGSIGVKTVLLNEHLKHKTGHKRILSVSDIKFEFSGKKDNTWDFSIKAIPQLYYFNSAEWNKTKKMFKANSIFKYSLTQNTSLNLEYNQDNQLIDLHKNIDTLQLSFNNRLVNRESIKEVISTNRDVSLGYYYSSIIKTESLNASVSYAEENNFLQPIFSTIENNIFYYDNTIIAKKQISSFSVNASKGYYVTKDFHLFKISGGYSYSFSQFPTFVSMAEKNYSIENQNVKSRIGIEPKNFFVNEIYFTTSLNRQKLFLEDSKINFYDGIVYALEVNKKKDSFEFNFSIGKKVNKTTGNTFDIPFLDINSTFSINEKLSIFIKSKYLFHLFGFPNTEKTDLNVISDGNLIYKSYNKNNLNYILFGLSYKL